MAIGDSAFRQIIRRHFNVHAVADQDADAVAAHSARNLRHHDMLAAVDLDLKAGISLFIDNRPGNLN